MGSHSIQDRFDQNDSHREWLDHYSVGRKSTPYLPPHDGPHSVGPDSFPGPKYDSISIHQSDQPLKRDFQLDVLAPPVVPTVLSTGGVAVYLGPDGNGGAAIDIRAPDQMFNYVPPWLADARRVDETERARKKKDVELAPGRGGLLAAVGRFVSIPLSRTANFLGRLGAKAFDALLRPMFRPIAIFAKTLSRASNTAINFVSRWVSVVWGPVDRALDRAFNWVGTQVQRAEPYLEAGYEWIKSRGKRVLDAVIVEAPLSAWSTLKQWPGKLAAWLDRTADRLWN